MFTKRKFQSLPLGEPLTMYDLQNIDDCLVVLTFRGKPDMTLCRWGWKRFPAEDASYQGFWMLDNTNLPGMPWNTYGTNWQAHRVYLPHDIRDFGIVFAG